MRVGWEREKLTSSQRREITGKNDVRMASDLYGVGAVNDKCKFLAD